MKGTATNLEMCDHCVYRIKNNKASVAQRSVRLKPLQCNLIFAPSASAPTKGMANLSPNMMPFHLHAFISISFHLSFLLCLDICSCSSWVLKAHIKCCVLHGFFSNLSSGGNKNTLPLGSMAWYQPSVWATSSVSPASQLFGL